MHNATRNSLSSTCLKRTLVSVRYYADCFRVTKCILVNICAYFISLFRKCKTKQFIKFNYVCNSHYVSAITVSCFESILVEANHSATINSGSVKSLPVRYKCTCIRSFQTESVNCGFDVYFVHLFAQLINSRTNVVHMLQNDAIMQVVHVRRYDVLVWVVLCALCCNFVLKNDKYILYNYTHVQTNFISIAAFIYEYKIHTSYVFKKITELYYKLI